MGPRLLALTRRQPARPIARTTSAPAKGKVEPGTGINHLDIQVESPDAALADLAVKGIAADSPADPDHADRPRTSWITDPDGYRIELVQWPAGHADGITKADFPEPTDPARMPAAH